MRAVIFEYLYTAPSKLFIEAKNAYTFWAESNQMYVSDAKNFRFHLNEGFDFLKLNQIEVW